MSQPLPPFDINYCINSAGQRIPGDPIGPIPIIQIHDLLIYIALIFFCVFITYIAYYYFRYRPDKFPWKAFGILFLVGNIIALLSYTGVLMWEYQCNGVILDAPVFGSSGIKVKKGQKVVQGKGLGLVIIPLIGVILFFLILGYNVFFKNNYLFRRQDEFPWSSVAMNLVFYVLLVIYMLINYLKRFD